MKTTFYKPIIVTLILLLSSYSMWSQEKVSKRVEKIYPLTNTGELHLDNKYGNILINGWEEKTIQIIVNIEVNKKKKEDATELLKRIKPVIHSTEDFIRISSVIEEKNNSMFSRLFDKANPFDFDRGNIQINYDIYLPLNAEINITNKFGDIIMNGWNGKLKVNQQHGDVWINKSLDNANIEMKFGTLKTKSITYGSIRFKNGEIDIEESEELKITSSGTTITIENVAALEIESSKDKIEIQKIGNINGELKFSNMILNNVSEDINLTMEVTDFRVSKLQKPNANIKINQESSELNINIAGTTLDFNASLEQGLLRIPRSFTNVKTDMIDKRKRIRKINAKYGTQRISGQFQVIGKKGIIILTE